MKSTFEKIYGGLVLLLAVVVVWSFWQSPNAPAADAAAVLRERIAQLQNGTEARAASLTFGLDRVDFLREHRLGGFPLAQYLASLIYVFLALQAARLADYLTHHYLKRWARKTETKFDDLLVAVLDGPAKIISFLVLLYFGVEFFFDWSLRIEALLKKGMILVSSVVLTRMVIRVTDVLSRDWIRRIFKGQDTGFHDQMLPLVRQSLRVFIIAIAALITLQSLGLNVTALIGSLGVVGLALSLASKDTVENYFGAVSVFVDRPFKVGDRIKLGDVDGAVEQIGLRSTRVRSLDGYLITVPNKMMGSATITNIAARPTIKTVANIGITYDTPAERIREAVAILENICREHPKTSDFIVSFDRFADSALNIQCVHWWAGTDNKEYLEGIQQINLEIKRRFDEAGIQFAFPSRTIYLRQEAAAAPPSAS